MLDFLGPENIVTDLEAHSLDEAVENLVRLAIASNGLPHDFDQVRAAVAEREAEASTCLGSGLALPHARLEGLDRVRGALGISREGLDFPTPDGEPVTLMVLLLTPVGAHEEHLAVLGALAALVTQRPERARALREAGDARGAAALLREDGTAAGG